jgi:CheY-like chemotaxis protein
MAANCHNIYRVLIVDDEPAVRTMLAELLAGPTRSVEVRDTPRAALEFLRHNPVDLAVLDMMMPGMNGVELAKKIKAKCPRAHIVMCTGFVAEATAANATTNAVERIFEKPFNLGELLEVADAHTSEAA